jgi:hypothetical protein
MPYICVESNRYIGEHSCGIDHYGNRDMVRECCVADCKKWAETAKRVAMTNWHPSYRLYMSAWNSLTDAEMKLCPNFTIHSNGEISERAQLDLPLVD